MSVGYNPGVFRLANRLRRSAGLRRIDRLLAKSAKLSESIPLRRAAEKVSTRKHELASLAKAQSVCGECARSCTGVAGVFSGGLCCSGSTENVFTEVEIAALAMNGTRTRHLRQGASDAGCTFRDASGCTLAAEHRPSVCVHYVCRDLMGALAKTEDPYEVAAAQARLEAAFVEFTDIYERESPAHELAELLGEAPSAARHLS